MRQADEKNNAPSNLTGVEDNVCTCMKWELLRHNVQVKEHSLSIGWWKELHLVLKRCVMQDLMTPIEKKQWQTGSKAPLTHTSYRTLQCHVNRHQTGWISNQNQSSSNIYPYSIGTLKLKINNQFSQGEHIDILALIISHAGSFDLVCPPPVTWWCRTSLMSISSFCSGSGNINWAATEQGLLMDFWLFVLSDWILLNKWKPHPISFSGGFQGLSEF